MPSELQVGGVAFGALIKGIKFLFLRLNDCCPSIDFYKFEKIEIS
ncbi:hypothetical protein SAMN05444394_1407 [Algoriphagus halophilus]|uniref:Uncharacterized protein n=1 Tax=Algoriphagus halophilus TaxID=226505 RepID=A0A1N6DUG0_9BACT|nr:hypothetical protein SAMN05444394_1407 [Algoriphagus halophilus]